MRFTSQNIDQQFNRANIAINNALAEPSLAAALAGFGYTAERLRQGGTLREEALAQYQRQKGAQGDAKTANDAYLAALAAGRETYMRYLKVARVVLEGERGPMQKLELAGERKNGQAALLAQAQQFYTQALADKFILDKLALFGITKVMLMEGQRQCNLIAQSDATRRQRNGAAADATRARDVALVALAAWMRDFVAVARVALRGRPQLLQMLGVSTPATRRAARPSPGTVAAAATVDATVAELATPLPAPQPFAEAHSARSAAAKRNGTKLAAVAE